jgi:hypothetical protein
LSRDFREEIRSVRPIQSRRSVTSLRANGLAPTKLPGGISTEGARSVLRRSFTFDLLSQFSKVEMLDESATCAPAPGRRRRGNRRSCSRLRQR